MLTLMNKLTGIMLHFCRLWSVYLLLKLVKTSIWRPVKASDSVFKRLDGCSSAFWLSSLKILIMKSDRISRRFWRTLKLDLAEVRRRGPEGSLPAWFGCSCVFTRTFSSSASFHQLFTGFGPLLLYISVTNQMKPLLFLKHFQPNLQELRRILKWSWMWRAVDSSEMKNFCSKFGLFWRMFESNHQFFPFPEFSQKF